MYRRGKRDTSTEATACSWTSQGCSPHVKCFQPCSPFSGHHPFMEMQWATAFSLCISLWKHSCLQKSLCESPCCELLFKQSHFLGSFAKQQCLHSTVHQKRSNHSQQETFKLALGLPPPQKEKENHKPEKGNLAGTHEKNPCFSSGGV